MALDLATCRRAVCVRALRPSFRATFVSSSIIKATYIADSSGRLSMAVFGAWSRFKVCQGKRGCIHLVKLIFNAMGDILAQALTEAEVVLQLWFGSFDSVILWKMATPGSCSIYMSRLR